jgi:hypothetical protein
MSASSSRGWLPCAAPNNPSAVRNAQSYSTDPPDSSFAKATVEGSVLGVDDVDSGEEPESSASWTQSTSSFQAKSTRIALLDPKPALVRATLSNRLFIDRAGVPGRLLAQLKRLAAFQNPEFHKRRMQRLSTHGIPRIISCGEVLSGHLALPRALVREVTTCLSEHGVGLELEDRREHGRPISVEFQGELTEIQRSALARLLVHDTGVFVAPPGIGKTVVGTALVAARRCSTLVLVHRMPLPRRDLGLEPPSRVGARWGLPPRPFMDGDRRRAGPRQDDGAARDRPRRAPRVAAGEAPKKLEAKPYVGLAGPALPPALNTRAVPADSRPHTELVVLESWSRMDRHSGIDSNPPRDNPRRAGARGTERSCRGRMARIPPRHRKRRMPPPLRGPQPAEREIRAFRASSPSTSHGHSAIATPA